MSRLTTKQRRSRQRRRWWVEWAHQGRRCSGPGCNACWREKNLTPMYHLTPGVRVDAGFLALLGMREGG